MGFLDKFKTGDAPAKTAGSDKAYTEQSPFLRTMLGLALGVGAGALTGDMKTALTYGAVGGATGGIGASTNNAHYKDQQAENSFNYNFANDLNKKVNGPNSTDLPKIAGNGSEYQDYVKTYFPKYQDVNSDNNTAQTQQDRLDNGTVNFNNGYMKADSINNIANDQMKLLQEANNKGNFENAVSFLQNLQNKTQSVNNVQPKQGFNSSFSYGGKQFNQPGMSGGVSQEQYQGGQPNVYNLWGAPGYNSDAMKETLKNDPSFDISARNTQSQIDERDQMLPGKMEEQTQRNKFFPLTQQYNLGKPYFNPDSTPYGQMTDNQQHIIDSHAKGYQQLKSIINQMETRTQPSPYPWDNGKLLPVQSTDADYQALGYKDRQQAFNMLHQMENNGWNSNSSKNNDPLGIR